MKKLFYSLFLAVIALASCQTLDPENRNQGNTDNPDPIKDTVVVPSKPVDSTIVVGVCPCGIGSSSKKVYEKCLGDVNAKVVFFSQYAFDTALADDYVYQVDAIIVPGSFTNDDDNRAQSDDNIIRAALEEKKPLLGICFGHQRINKVLGGNILKVKDKYPESTIEHKIKDASGNVGLYTDAHSISIEKNSNLYHCLGDETSIMVNTSHDYCAYKISSKLRVVATAPDGVVEGLEGDGIMCVQFHPEHLYGTMNKPVFLGIFEKLVNDAKAAKFPENK